MKPNEISTEQKALSRIKSETQYNLPTTDAPLEIHNTENDHKPDGFVYQHQPPADPPVKAPDKTATLDTPEKY